MVSQPVLFTQKELELIAKNRGYKEPHKMSMDALLDIIYSKPYIGKITKLLQNTEATRNYIRCLLLTQ